MKTLTVIILYDKNSEKNIEPLKEQILSGVDKNDINFVTYFSEDDKYIIKDIDTLNSYDSKYLCVVNALDTVTLLPDTIETLKENNYYILFDDFLIYDDERETMSSEYESLDQIYNKMIRIDYLKKIFHDSDIFINDLLYENYPTEESFRYFNLRYTFKKRPFPVEREREADIEIDEEMENEQVEENPEN